MREVRIWINSEDSVNIVTDIEEDVLKNHLKAFKTLETRDKDIDIAKEIERFLVRLFSKDQITIIPREVEEIEFTEL